MNIDIKTGWTRADTAIGDRLARAASDRTLLSPSFLVNTAARIADLATLVFVAAIAQLNLELGLLFVTVSLAAVWSTGLRSGRLAPRVSDEVPYLARNVALAMAGFGLIAGSRIQFGEAVWLGILILALVVVERAIFYDLLRRLRSRGVALEPVIVVGAGPTAERLAAAMDEHPEYGLRPIGFVDSGDTSPLPAPYLGEVTDLPDIMNRNHTRHVVFAFGAAREYEMISTIRRSDPRAHFYVLVRFFELGVAGGPPSLNADLAGFPVRRIRPPAAGSPMLWTKRLIDLIVATFCLVIFAPVMLVCAALVARSSPGPILFRQTRVGRNGEEFDILKFRTMTVNDDSDVTWTVENDSRVTPVGRVMRATHLDELPQLVNVIRGEMSLVGPRPERPFFVDRFGEEIQGYRDRHRVKTGITGWSQVNGLVGDSSIEERVRRDNWYIEHWSVWTDALIVMRTLTAMIRRGN
ncbi:MAG: sugar transferase [marine benthic group bacterium]|nr:sugar transferase [Gemmatimonadota bacterium]